MTTPPSKTPKTNQGTVPSKFTLGKPMSLLASLQSTGEGLLTGGWMFHPQKLHRVFAQQES